jgi:hypothetical protein
VLRSWIIDDSAGERRLSLHMGKHFAEGRFDLASQIRSSGCHRFRSSFLIAATSRDWQDPYR